MFGFVVISIMLIAINAAFIEKWKKMSHNSNTGKRAVSVLSVMSVVSTLVVVHNIYKAL